MPYLAGTSSAEVPDEKKNIAGTLGLLELAKWAQEQQFEWKGSPNVGINHDAYFIEAAEAALEADKGYKKQKNGFSLLSDLLS